MSEETKEYFLEAHNTNYEPIVRKFLLERANKVGLTNTRFWEGTFPRLSIRHYGNSKHPKLMEVLEDLKGEYIQEVINNEKYHIKQGLAPNIHHYFFKLTPKLKDLFNRETLIWHLASPGERYFYTLEDPSFYQNKKLLGHIITHESYIFLYLTLQEKGLLEKEGIDFTPAACPVNQKPLKWWQTLLFIAAGIVFVIWFVIYKIIDYILWSWYRAKKFLLRRND